MRARENAIAVAGATPAAPVGARAVKGSPRHHPPGYAPSGLAVGVRDFLANRPRTFRKQRRSTGPAARRQKLNRQSTGL